jgi:hypothetical protein
MMRLGKLCKLNGALFLAAFVGLAAAGSAWAIEWQQGGKPIVGVGVGVNSKPPGIGGELLFKDVHVGVAVSCEVTDGGSAGPGAEGTITMFSTGPTCKLVEKGESECVAGTESVGTFNLPWQTDLVEEGGEKLDKIKTKTGGSEPKFEITCDKEGGGFVDDTCNAETSATVANAVGGVMATFGGHKTTCEGVPGSGEISGKDLISGCPNMSIK